MAYAVEIQPEELEAVRRTDAAEILREIIVRQRARQDARPDPHSHDAEIVRQMAEFFEDDSVSADEKRDLAEKFFRVLPYYVAGQRPPRELLGDEDPPENGGTSRSA